MVDTTFGATSLFSSGVSSIASGVGNIFAGQAAQYTVQQQQANAAAAQQQSIAAQTAATGDLLQGQGDIIEAQMYGTAAGLATEQATFAETSTAIQQAQAQRQLYMQLGSQRAAAGGSGSSGGGSAADILRTSAQQGALNTAVLGAQGQITVAGYKEQAQSYTDMAAAANVAQQVQQTAATGEEATAQAYLDTAQGYDAAAQAAAEAGTGSTITGAIQTGGGAASLAVLAAAAVL